jgi:hypothetical protein
MGKPLDAEKRRLWVLRGALFFISLCLLADAEILRITRPWVAASTDEQRATLRTWQDRVVHSEEFQRNPPGVRTLLAQSIRMGRSCDDFATKVSATYVELVQHLELAAAMGLLVVGLSFVRFREPRRETAAAAETQ